MDIDRRHPLRAAFTLIELLVVIAIIAILSVVVILTLNPAQLLKQSRDSNRFSDLASISSAIGIFQADQPSGSLGDVSTVYISVPDSSATCANLGLPTLPSGWSYGCASSDNLRKVDGTGWIPLEFTSISSGAPVSSLPIDPTNSTSTGLFYAYVNDGNGYHFGNILESQKYLLGGAQDKVSKDGGSYPDLFELGTEMTLLPVNWNPTLVAYYKFDEGSGAIAYDASGHGNNGVLTSGPSWTTSGCIHSNCLTFDGVNAWVSVTSTASLSFSASQPRSYLAWASDNSNGNYPMFISRNGVDELRLNGAGSSGPPAFIAGNGGVTAVGSVGPSKNIWHLFAGVFDGTNTLLYQDGILIGSASGGAGAVSSLIGIAQRPTEIGTYGVTGIMDNIRIYNRAISTAEMLAIYNSRQ